nr:hypothetical protein [Actinomycetota bacterium]
GDIPDDAHVDDLLDERPAIDEIEGTSLELKLEGFGFRWFRIGPSDQQTPP